MVLNAGIVAKSSLPKVGNHTKRFRPPINQPSFNQPPINFPSINKPPINFPSINLPTINRPSGSSGSSSSSSSSTNDGESSSSSIDGESIISLAETISGEISSGSSSSSSSSNTSGRKSRMCASTSTCRALSTSGTCCTSDLCNGANRASVGGFRATLLAAVIALIYNYTF